MNSKPFRLIRPWFARKARSTSVPKMTQSKPMYNTRLSSTLIGCLRFCRRVKRSRRKNRGIQGSMDSRPFQLLRHFFARKARSTPDPKMIRSKAMYNPRLLSTLIERLRLCRGVARLEVQNQGIQGSMDSRPFRLIRPKFACKARSAPYPKMIQTEVKYNLGFQAL